MPNKDLQEKDFIQDSLRKNPLPAWIWLVVITCLAAILWGISSWYSKFMVTETNTNPFLQVTNRQFSLFLWQFPEYMKANYSSKSSYLPGFQSEGRVNVIPSEAEKYVSAPPEILFLYHTWKRLIQNEFSSRSIPVNVFKEFLDYAEEWQPQNWPAAPQSYANLIKNLPKSNADLNTLPEAELPLEVRQAFQGWRNYFKEGDAINSIHLTFDETEQFLNNYPHYARNYWRNIVEKNYPEYLKSTLDSAPKDKTLADNEVAPFLRVAFYNFMQLEKEKGKNNEKN